jgi:hypothetical protein
MNCKTGCGKEADSGLPMCYRCRLRWSASPERNRAEVVQRTDTDEVRALRRQNVAVVDFCNRVRAERQNTKSEGTT